MQKTLLVVFSVLVLSTFSLPTEKMEGKDTKFKHFLPFLSEIVTYTGAIIPTAMAKKHKHSQEFEALLQTHSQAAKNGSDPFDRTLTSNQTVELMMGMGKKAQQLVGYNPIEFMTDLIGKDGLVQAVDVITQFGDQFPDTVTEKQVQDAEMMVLTLGVYGADSEKNVKATEEFMQELTPKQNELIQKLQHDVIEKVVNAMINADGTPTQALIDETEKQLSLMEKSPIFQLLNAALGVDAKNNKDPLAALFSVL